MHGAKTLSGINFFHWDWYLTHSMSSSAVPSTTGFRPCPVHYKERFVSRMYALPPVSTKQPLDSQRGYLAGVCMSGSDRASPQHRLRLFCALSPVPIGPATHNFPSTAKRQNQMAGTAVLSSSCCKRINRHSFHSSLRWRCMASLIAFSLLPAANESIAIPSTLVYDTILEIYGISDCSLSSPCCKRINHHSFSANVCEL
jgi:hypothetical protein